MRVKAVVIGGGIAGMSCADELQRAGCDFRLITDRLGGRIVYDEKDKVNFGAYFVMENYTNARKIVGAARWINPLDACFHNGVGESFNTLSLHTVKRIPDFIRFLKKMLEFRKHYATYKQHCLVMSQRDAMDKDVYIKSMFSIPAKQFIESNGLEKVASDYVSKFAYACTGVDYSHITALDFMNVSQGLLEPIFQITFDEHAKAAQYGDCLIEGMVTSIERDSKGYTILTDSGDRIETEMVVAATPAAITQKLLGIPKIRDACQLYVHYVEAVLKPLYAKRSLNLFPYSSEIVLTARQADGRYLIYARTPDADIGIVCESFKELKTRDWDRAMYVHGESYLEQNLAGGLFTAGDHNGLGLEPSAISGIYAAKQIIEKC
ncbi:MAG: FAD-dependent oxidoreductase [Oscillospiraceae bacterium]